MDVIYSEDQKMIAQMIQAFGEKEILPYCRAWDEAQEFPRALFKKLGQLGLMGVLVPEQYGGAAFSYFEYVTAVTELAKMDGAIALSMAAHNSLCIGHILQFGNEQQKKKWLPKLASGEWVGAWALTEPNTGSDAANMKTIAQPKGDYWIINGSKNFITHGKSGNIVVVIVRTGKLGDSRGMTALVIEKGTPGFSAGKKQDKMGMRASETTELLFDNCKVPKENILGKVGKGFIQAMKVLEGGRISIAALSLGIAEGAFEAALKYAKKRHQFNQPIANFQAIAFKLADLATKIEAAKLLIFRTAEEKNKKREANIMISMAKYFASELAVEAANEAVQILGGYGYSKEFLVEKYYRDAKLCTIGEGTSEIQKMIIAKNILKK